MLHASLSIIKGIVLALLFVHAQNVWRHYLMSNHYNVFVNHKSLKYIFTHKELNMRQIRWLELIKY
jgi:hypothetical protein